MYESILELLRCPDCSSSLLLESGEVDGKDVIAGELSCRNCKRVFPILNGIPRFVPIENYADNFGFEWGLFGDLQVDRLQNNSLTRDRFFTEIGCTPEDLKGMRVLEAGCGGGRFSDIVLECGAELVAVDLSAAVDKNREIHPGHPRLNLVQASITDLPLEPESFDLVFCFGVLQHTPDPHATLRALVPFVKPGGRLAVDVYAAHPKQALHWKYLLRPITKRMDDRKLLAAIQWAAPKLLPISRQVRRIPVLGKPLSRLVPLFVHDGFMGLVSPEQEERWAVLETFDALSPAYDRPKARRTIQRWLEGAGLVDVQSFNINNALNYGGGTKPERAIRDAR